MSGTATEQAWRMSVKTARRWERQTRSWYKHFMEQHGAFKFSHDKQANVEGRKTTPRVPWEEVEMVWPPRCGTAPLHMHPAAEGRSNQYPTQSVRSQRGRGLSLAGSVTKGLLTRLDDRLISQQDSAQSNSSSPRSNRTLHTPNIPAPP